jgi:hypothetical protein
MGDKQKVNKRNRSFISGKPIGDDLRTLAITSIAEAGGDTDTRHVPRGVFSRVANTVKLSNTAVRNIMMGSLL